MVEAHSWDSYRSIGGKERHLCHERLNYSAVTQVICREEEREEIL